MSSVVVAPPEQTVEVPVPGSPSTAMPLPPRELREDVAPPSSLVVGVSGQRMQGGLPAEEYNPQLKNRDKAIEHEDELRTGNALVAGPLLRIEAQLRQADWSFVPGPRLEPSPSIRALREKHGLPAEDLERDDLEHEAVQFHSSWLFGAPAHEYTMETSWQQQALHEALTSHAFPAAVFEIVWRRVDGRLGTRVVPQVLRWMHPRSIRAFKMGENGRLKGIVQATQHSWDPSEDESFGGGRSKYHRKFIRERDLLIVARNREGTMPEGTPLIRHMFADAERASAAIKWQLIDAQNRAVGIPYVEIPKGVQGKVVENAIKQARRMTYGNQHLAYVVSPEGIKVGFIDMSANTVDLASLVTAQERRMRHVSGTEFTALGGEGGTGAFALAKILREEFNVLVSGLAAALIEDVQRGLVDRVHAYNYGDRIASPRLHAGGLITIDPLDLATLVEKKVVGVDTDVENAARRTLGLGALPQKNSEKLDTSQLNDLAMAKAIVMTGEAVNKVHEAIGLPPLSPEKTAEYNETPFNAGGPGLALPPPAPAPAAAAAPEQLARKPSGKSRAEDVRETRKAFVERVVEKLMPMRAAAVREIAGKATTAEDRLGGRLEPSKETRAKFRNALRALAGSMLDYGRRTGREDIETSAKTHGRLVRMASVRRPQPLEILAKVEHDLDLVVELNADAILDAIEPMLRKAYLQARKTVAESTEKALAEAVTLVESWGVKQVETAAHEAAARGINAGRRVSVEEAQELLAIEGLALNVVKREHHGDDAPCDYCKSVEGQEYEIDSPEYLVNEPPNNCAGGDRCHCYYILEVTKAAGTPTGERERSDAA